MKIYASEEEKMIFDRLEAAGLEPRFVGSSNDHIVKHISCEKSNTLFMITASYGWFDNNKVKHYLVDIGGYNIKIPTPYYMTIDEFITKCKNYE